MWAMGEKYSLPIEETSGKHWLWNPIYTVTENKTEQEQQKQQQKLWKPN